MIYSLQDNGEITKNSIVDMQEHLVDEYYNIIPRYWAIDSYGVVNSRKPIKATNKNSVMCYDEIEKQIVLKSIETYAQEPTRYHMIIGSPEINLNKGAKITVNGKSYDVELDYIMGFMLLIYLKQLAGVPNVTSTQMIENIDVYEDQWSEWFEIEYDLYKKTYNGSLSSIKLINIKEDSPFKILADSIISNKHGKYTIANEIFYSTNIDFNAGILDAIVNSEMYMVREIGELITHVNINPSVYTNVLNIFFANYNITKASYLKYPSDILFSIKYSVSEEKLQYLRYSNNKIKVHRYTRFLRPDGSMVIDNWNSKERYQEGEFINDTVKDLIELKNKDKIKFIRFDELVLNHVRTSEPVPLYDLVMGNGSATNYLLSGTPWAKNSDGDVLAVMSLMTKESIEAGKKLMMSNTDRLKDGTEPDKIRNWVQKDAIVGLYQATKE